MMYSLYGTYLVFQVEDVLSKNGDPLTVRQVANRLAQLPPIEQANLIRRVRRVLNGLTEQGRAECQEVKRHNIIVFTYRLANSESDVEETIKLGSGSQ